MNDSKEKVDESEYREVGEALNLVLERLKQAWLDFLEKANTCCIE